MLAEARKAAVSETVYIFLDEGGNFDFSPRGTAYFTLTAVTMRRPFLLHDALDALKHDHLEQGLPLLAFHCAEDNKATRRQVFDCIGQHLDALRIDSLVVEKCKTEPSLRAPERFYPEMLGHLLKYVMNDEPAKQAERLVVITDTIPVQKQRKAVEKAIKQTLARMLPAGVTYDLLHHPSCSHYGLQVADYCNWAVLRKWQQGETFYYDKVRRRLFSESDIFRLGAVTWY